jgi:hypothetical protein
MLEFSVSRSSSKTLSRSLFARSRFSVAAGIVRWLRKIEKLKSDALPTVV